MPASHSFRRKPNRLPLAAYSRRNAVSLTIVTQHRVPVFASGGWAMMFADTLRRVTSTRPVRVFAYCFMPDHLHMLVQGAGSESLIDFVADFKQRTAHSYTRATGERLWQKSYHDHFLRSDEDLLAAARYVFANPVREGFVARADEYTHSGSFVWDRGVLVEA